MRTKKVEEAINRTQQLKQFIKERGKEFSFYDNENSVIAYESLETLLAYIEKLEKQEDRDYTTIYIKGVADKDGVWRDKIRDKIKEIEEKRAKTTCADEKFFLLLWQADILKEILGE
jgi:hypothetical protein